MRRFGITEGENMAQEQSPSAGPDLAQGVALEEFANGKLVGRVSQNDGSGWSDRFALSFVYALSFV
jgi:hypothetical protein